MPTTVGKQQIEDDQVMGLVKRGPEPGVPIGRDLHRVTLRLQPARDEIEDPLLVVNQENAGAFGSGRRQDHR